MNYTTRHGVRIRVISDERNVVVHEATTWEDNPVGYLIEWGALLSCIVFSGYLLWQLLKYTLLTLL